MPAKKKSTAASKPTKKPQTKKKNTISAKPVSQVETTEPISTPEPTETAAARPDYLIEIDRVFQLQKDNRWNIANTSADERIKKLKKLEDAILKSAPDLIDAMQKDFRKSPAEVEITEIMPTISEIKDACHHLRDWMKPTYVGTPLPLIGTSSKIVYEPKGIVLIMGPWNYPFQLVMAPLIAAISAGNCSIIRPSNNTKNTSAYMKNLLKDLFPENEVAVFLGDHNTSNALLEKPFDHIFFTGSPSVGKTIMQAAAKHLASVTLELGGKSPVIIDNTADINDTATKVIWGKVLNGGQTCVGVDYVLVHESKHDEFIEKAKEQIKKFYGQTPENWESTPDLCRIINDKNFNRLKETVESTLNAGAKLEIGGIFKPETRYIAPTILSNVPMDSAIMQEEIFGPILPVIKYNDLEDAIRIVQSKEKPLALYIFSKKDANIEKVLKNTSSGGTVVNGVIIHLANSNLPFGGVNHSGIGNYHGHYGFKTFSHERSVLTMSRFSALKTFFPPYSKTTSTLVNMINKYL